MSVADGTDNSGATTGAVHPLVGVGRALHDLLGPAIDARKKAHLTDVLETFESDLAPVLAPILADALANPDLPEPIRTLLATVGTPEHMTSSLVIGIAVGAILSPVIGGVLAPTIQAISNREWSQNTSMPLSPAELAAGVLKGVFNDAHAQDQAAQSGISQANMTDLISIAGQSIGTAEALLLLRRGDITDAEFLSVLQYSNVNPKFYTMAGKLRYGEPSVGEVVAGYLKGHLTAEAAGIRLGKAGLDPANLEWLKATAGRPIGIEQAVHLWLHGMITDAQLEQVVAQSDVNLDYLPLVKLSGVYFPPVRTITALVRQGALNDAQATTLYQGAGVRQQDIGPYLAGAHHTSASTQRHVTAGQIVRMYESRFVDRAGATTRLTALNFPADEITLMLDYADDLRTEKLLNAGVTKVGTAYVAHRIDKPAATTALTGMGLTAAAAGEHFAIWDIERTTLIHHPTPTQVINAYRRGMLNEADAHRHLLAAGIPIEDFAIYIADGYPLGKQDEASAAILLITAG